MRDAEKNEARIERRDEGEAVQELKLADKLAVERTVLAADRTMLAGVRTSMSFIGFGFTIFNLLKYLQEHGPTKFMRTHTPRNFALFLLLVGTVPLFVMTIQYARILKRMGRKERIVSNPNFQMAVAILSLGTVMAVSIIWDILVM